jgi:hypothetical protein
VQKKILVSNNNWDKARAELKTTLQAQNASFNAQLKAAFAPPAPEASTEEAPAKPARRDESILARSRRHG